MSFEDKLKQEIDDYCRFKCPVKGHILDDDGFNVFVCETCQVNEFIRYIRDMEQ